MDKHPTTRRWPRTMQEAFPRDAQHAYAIEAYRTPGAYVERLLYPLLSVASVVACAALIVWTVLEWAA